MDKLRRSYPDIAPTIGQYHRGIRAGDFLFISGTTALGSEAEGGPFANQLRVTLDRLRRILESEGGSAGDMVRITTYVTSIADWDACETEREAIFEECFKGAWPTNTLVEITALARPTLHVEIDVIAML